MRKILKSLAFTVAFFTGGIMAVHGATLLMGCGNNINMRGLDNGIYVDIADRDSDSVPWMDDYKESDEKPWDAYASMQYVHVAYGVKNIGKNAFNGRKDIIDFYLPNSIKADRIGENAFAGCNRLENVYFNGTEEEAESYKDTISNNGKNCKPLADANWICFDKGAFSQTLEEEGTIKVEGDEECKTLLNTISYLVETERLYDTGSSGDDGNYNQCERFWDYRIAATDKSTPDFVAHFTKNFFGKWTGVEISACKNHTTTDIVLNDYYTDTKFNIFGRAHDCIDKYNHENVDFTYENFFDSFEIKYAANTKEEEKKDNKTEEKKTEENKAEDKKSDVKTTDKNDDSKLQKTTKVGVGYQFSDKNFTYEITKFEGKGKKFKGEVTVVKFNRKKAKTAKVKAVVKFKGKKYKVTGIGAEAFANSKVKKIIIGKNVQSMGSKVFFKCKKLKQIIIKSAGINSIFVDTFKGVPRKCKVKVPNFKKSNYKYMFKKYGGLKGKIK